VTSGGRNADCPLFLSSAAEQVLNSGVIAGYGLEDDSGLLRVYLPSKDGLVYKQATAPSTSTDDPKLKLVEDILVGVHLAAAVEAMVFGKKIGLDPDLLYEIVKGAAGVSAMFTEKVPAMIAGKSTSQGSIKEVVTKLVSSTYTSLRYKYLLIVSQKVAVEEASRLKYPLHLTATALQLFQLAAATGSADDPDVSIARIWDVRT
jgi:3-hydroxyisobutyrate dehydrogenase